MERASSEDPSSPVYLRHSCWEGRNVLDVGTITGASFLVLSTYYVPSDGLRTYMHDLICPNSGPMWQVLSNSHVTEKRSERSSDLSKVTQDLNLTLWKSRARGLNPYVELLRWSMCTLLLHRLFLCLLGMVSRDSAATGAGFPGGARKSRSTQSLKLGLGGSWKAQRELN